MTATFDASGRETRTSHEKRRAAWLAKREAAHEAVRQLGLPVAYTGEETAPFEALMYEGWVLLGGTVTHWHVCKVAMNRHGWPILVPCHPDGRNRTAVCFGGINRRRFGFEHLVSHRPVDNGGDDR